MSISMKRGDFDDHDIELLDRDDPMQRMPFLGSRSKVGKTVGSRLFNYGRHFRKIGVFVVILVVIVFVFDTWGDAFLEWVHADYDDALTTDRDEGQPLHVLIPATAKDVNLCKTTLGLNILGYEAPTFLGWERSYDNSSMKDGGAQIGTKITQALAYVNTLENEKDLVLIADGYDTWFQLTEVTLRQRYFLALAGAHYRMRHRLGRRAIRREGMKDRVVFAAGKTCIPNGLHTIACYPIMEPPTSKDMYGDNTDTNFGVNRHSSYRPRYLDAAFMMGPVRHVRKVLQRAQELVEELPETEPMETPYSSEDENEQPVDPNSPPSAHLYHGDPQSIFARIFGQQVFQREVIRLRYRSWFKKWSPPHTPGFVEGKRYPDLLKPPFPHEHMKKLDGHPMDYGIMVDYTGLIGSSTFNAARDFKALTFNGSWEPESIPDLHRFDCKPKIKSKLPEDIETAPLPEAVSNGVGPTSWAAAAKLFSNMCLGHIPVIVHHNGDKGFRNRWWSDVWYQKDARKMLQNLDQKNPTGGERKPSVGAWTDNGKWMGWREVCPAEWDDEVFGTSS